MSLPDDLRSLDPDSLRRFLFSNHLGHSVSYEIAMRFGADNINPARRLLSRHIAGHLRSNGWIQPMLYHCG
jgi:hypothetical protein